MSQDKNLKEYTVKITQTLEGFATILAESREEAFQTAHKTYVEEGQELPDMEDNYSLKINVVEEKEIVPEVIKNNEPIYLVTYDNKGLSETNFISTKADLMKDIGIEEDFFFFFDGDENWHTYYVASNKTYDIYLCKSIKQLAEFLDGKYNTDIEELIYNNFEEGEYDGSYDDFYWCNEPEWCSKEAMDIAKLYALSTDDIELQKSILMGLNLIGVDRIWSSVTQGEAAVMINGKTIVQYADAMWLQSKDKSHYTNGFNEKSSEEVKFFKENAGGWGSIKSDDVFVKAALEQFPEKIKDALMETIDGKTVAEDKNKMTINDLKIDKDYSFECNIKKEYMSYEDHDEWGCAYLSLGDDIGVEYNFCIEGSENSSAIYKTEYDEATGYISTDTSTFNHYAIDFTKNNWKESLENAMCEALIEFFNLEKHKDKEIPNSLNDLITSAENKKGTNETNHSIGLLAEKDNR